MFNATVSAPPAITRTVRPDLLPFVSDAMLALVLPIIAYWTFSGFFALLDSVSYFDKFRLHTPEELTKRNRCTKTEVVRAVLIEHFLQTVAGIILMKVEGPQYTGHEAHDIWKLQKNFKLGYTAAKVLYYGVIPAVKIFVAFLIMDSWQFFLHRAMHMNKFLYKHLHSVHHRMYVPYAFGALYNSVLEGFLLDTAGAGLAYTLVGLSARESIIFYVFSTMKTVDDHCGYELPYDPFQMLFPNSSAYHDIHHQAFGIKTNFSQPFFVHWDEFFGTKYKDTEKYIAEQRAKRLEHLKLEKEKKTN